jgi:transposase
VLADLDRMISALIKENRELHRPIDRLSKQAVGAASGAAERALRSIQRRISSAVDSGTTTRRRRSVPLAPVGRAPRKNNYGTHGHENVQKWLAKHPRFHLHWTPTSSSWLNLVEQWFAELTNKAVRRGVFRSVPQLIEAIDAFLTEWNKDPKPFVWTATAADIISKVRRGRVALSTIAS